MKLSFRAYADTLVLALAGRLDHDNCDVFRGALQPHLDASALDGRGIVFDLSGLEYVSSAGLRCFMLAAKQANAHGGRMVVASMRPLVAEIFEISRFNLLFRAYPGVREALVALSPVAAAAFGEK
jgi:anti-anti-sigma factor